MRPRTKIQIAFRGFPDETSGGPGGLRVRGDGPGRTDAMSLAGHASPDFVAGGEHQVACLYRGSTHSGCEYAAATGLYGAHFGVRIKPGTPATGRLQVTDGQATWIAGHAAKTQQSRAMRDAKLLSHLPGRQPLHVEPCLATHRGFAPQPRLIEKIALKIQRVAITEAGINIEPA